jgi:hypothetical protein
VRPWSEQRRSIIEHRLHLFSKHIRFVNLQIIHLLTGPVRLHPFIDRFPQSEWRITLSTQPCAADFVFAGAAHLQTRGNPSAITHHKTGVPVLTLQACMEIVILQHKPASQETLRLVDDGLPGNRPLLAVDLAQAAKCPPWGDC